MMMLMDRNNRESSSSCQLLDLVLGLFSFQEKIFYEKKSLLYKQFTFIVCVVDMKDESPLFFALNESKTKCFPSIPFYSNLLKEEA